MSICTLIIGESGSGKSTSMRNVDNAFLIQCIRKPMPFKSDKWKYVDDKGGNVIVSDDYERIIALMKKTSKKMIIIDDFQYLMSGEFMSRSAERGYDKFTEIANHAYLVLRAAMDLPDDVTVYVLSHSETNEFGKTKFKTIGKLLDEKIVVEGLVSIVLLAFKDQMDQKHYFSTKSNGSSTVKTPMGMFEDDKIDNDLMAVDAVIRNYYA